MREKLALILGVFIPACQSDATPCEESRTSCDGACFDLLNDRAHCGLCGAACPEGVGCFAGSCGAAELSAARVGHELVVDDRGDIYAVGGIDGQTSGSFTLVPSFETRDHETNRWNVRQSPPAARSYPGAAFANGERLFFGGGDERGDVGVQADAWSYDRALDVWNAIGAMPVPRVDFATAVDHSGRVYAIAGLTGDFAQLSSMDVLGPDGWQGPIEIAVARWGMRAVVAADGRIFVCGGIDGAWPNAVATVDVYDPPSGSWSRSAPMHHARAVGAATLGIDGRIFYAGGLDAAGTALRSVEVYDPATDVWMAGEVPDMPDARFDTRAVTTSD